MWQLINKHVGKLRSSNQDIELKTDLGKITNPQTVAEILNSFYIDCIEKLLVQNKAYINGQTAQMKFKYYPNTMFVYPVTENELNQVVSKLQGKSATGFDQIPEFLVKEYIQYIKKRLIFIFNPLNAKLNPICYLLALLAHHFLHISRIRVKSLTLRLLMSYIYIYGAPILDVSRSHTTTQHSR